MRRALSTALLLALIVATAGFRGCDEGQKRTVERNVVTGLRVAARAVPSGIDVMRSLREAGEVDAATNLRLAELALKVNAATGALTKAALEGSETSSLAEQLDVVVSLAADLEREGTLGLKNGRTKLVFQLGVIAAKNGLVIARNELKASGGAGLSFTLDVESRASLEELRPQFERNDALLREAITRLGGRGGGVND